MVDLNAHLAQRRTALDVRRDPRLTEVATDLTGIYATRSCCVVADLVRLRREVLEILGHAA